MSVGRDLTELLARGVENCQRSVLRAGLSRNLPVEELFATVADDQMLVARVEAHVVSVGGKLGRHQKLKRAAVKDLYGAVALGGDEQMIGSCVEIGLLRMLEARNGVHLPAGLHVYDLDCLVVERGGEKPLAQEIDPDMVHAAIDLRQGDAALQFQGRRRLGHQHTWPKKCMEHECEREIVPHFHFLPAAQVANLLALCGLGNRSPGVATLSFVHCAQLGLRQMGDRGGRILRKRIDRAHIDLA